MVPSLTAYAAASEPPLRRSASVEGNVDRSVLEVDSDIVRCCQTDLPHGLGTSARSHRQDVALSLRRVTATVGRRVAWSPAVFPDALYQHRRQHRTRRPLLTNTLAVVRLGGGFRVATLGRSRINTFNLSKRGRLVPIAQTRVKLHYHPVPGLVAQCSGGAPTARRQVARRRAARTAPATCSRGRAACSRASSLPPRPRRTIFARRWRTRSCDQRSQAAPVGAPVRRRGGA